jgi:hypothetical protein
MTGHPAAQSLADATVARDEHLRCVSGVLPPNRKRRRIRNSHAVMFSRISVRANTLA